MDYKSRWLFLIVATSLIVTLAMGTSAAWADKTKDSVSDDGGWSKSSWMDWIDAQRDYLAGKVTVAGTALDQYIARDSFDVNTINQSYLRVRVGEQFTTDNSSGFKGNVTARIDVPNTKGKMKLFFDSDPDDFDSLEDKRAENHITINDGDAQDRAVAGISFFGKEIHRWRPQLALGLKLKIPVDPYIKAAVTRYKTLSEHWQSRFKETLFYYRSDGLGSDTQYDLYRSIDHDKMIRSRSEVQYLRNKQLWEFYQAFSLYKRIDKKNALQYTVYMSLSHKELVKVESYGAKVKWRRLLYKDWLFFNISPDIRFPRTEDFRLTPGILLELESFFGKNLGKA